MRSRQNPADSDTVARRLELLSRELAATRVGDAVPVAERVPDTHTRIRPPEPAEEEDGVQEGTSVRATAPLSVPARLPVPGRHAVRRSRPARLTELLPETLRGRIAIGPSQIAVIAVAVAVGLAVTTWWVVRSDPEIQPLAAPVEPATELVSVPADEPAPGAPVASAEGAETADPGATELVVDVAGKVRRPGIAVLPAGARVIDALDAAGGARKGVDVTALNLARPLVDGEQILVGVEPADGAPVTAAGPGGDAASPGGAALVNLNTADQTILETLPGVGPVTAGAILEWRAQHGAFSSVQELIEVNGIGEATLARLLPYVTI